MTLEAYTTIFYVDDDPDDRDFFEEVTQQIGEPISLFEVGEAMLTQLDNPPPNPSVVFLDLNMPGKNGFEILADIKASETFSGIPVIILSTTDNRDTVDRCYQLGASLYIKKSTSIAALKKSLEFVIATDWENHTVTEQNFLYKG